MNYPAMGTPLFEEILQASVALLEALPARDVPDA